MIKRFVILQDESLVFRELDRPRLVPNLPPMEQGPPPFHAPPPQAVAAPPPQAVAATPPAAAPAETDDADAQADDVPPPSTADGRRLSDVAREAALSAERTVIADTLRQVHWNRRKAAQLLGVSYKTLLNKIKETGIERP
jgi:DNA-binding NtrC family response regulator